MRSGRFLSLHTCWSLEDGEESPCKASFEQSARIHSSRRWQAPSMALLSSCLAGEVAFRLLFSPLGSKALARTACIVGGLAIPAYSSYKAIELKDTTEQEQWLLYWTAYGCLSAGEIFSDKLLSWLPGYYHAKLAFLMWLQLPLKNGARQFLSAYLRPPLLRYQCMLDGIMNGARNDINNFLLAYLQELKFIKAVVRKLAQYAFAPQKNVKSSSKFIDESE